MEEIKRLLMKELCRRESFVKSNEEVKNIFNEMLFDSFLRLSNNFSIIRHINNLKHKVYDKSVRDNYDFLVSWPATNAILRQKIQHLNQGDEEYDRIDTIIKEGNDKYRTYKYKIISNMSVNDKIDDIKKMIKKKKKWDNYIYDKAVGIIENNIDNYNLEEISNINIDNSDYWFDCLLSEFSFNGIVLDKNIIQAARRVNNKVSTQGAVVYR